MGISWTTVQAINDSAKNGRQNANLSQNKKSCKPTHNTAQISAHFILPNHTQHLPTFGLVTT